MTWKSILLASVALAGLGLPMGLYWPFGNHDDVLKLPGTVEIQEVRLGSKVGGRVASVAIAEGDQVELGQPLVTSRFRS